MNSILEIFKEKEKKLQIHILSIEKKVGEFKLVFLLGLIVGFITFIFLFGTSSLDINNIQWRRLPYGSDISFTQLAMDVFISGNWSFPPGKIDGFLYPNATSIVYTDAIPLAALIAKFIYPVIGHGFQFAGAYGAICFSLQGGFAAVLLKKFSNNKIHVLISTTFYTFSFPMVMKMCGHTSMVAHFPIIAAMCCWVHRDKKVIDKYYIVFFTLIMCVSAMTNAYLMPLIAAIMVGFFISLSIDNHKIEWIKFFKTITTVLVFTIFCMVIQGTFISKVEIGGDYGIGYALGSLNLNSFYNPYFSNGSHIIKSLPARMFQNEGYAWLGLGVIILGVVSFPYWISDIKKLTKDKVIQFLPYCTIGIIVYIVALSNVITLNDKILYVIQLPKELLKFLSTYRTTGRFVWLIYYMIYTLVIGMFLKYSDFSSKIKTIILIIVCSIQIWDMQGMPRGSTEGFVDNSRLESTFWDDLNKGGYNHMSLLPLGGRVSMEQWGELAYKAIDNKMTINLTQMARMPGDIIENSYRMIESIKNGSIPNDELIIINELSILSESNLVNREVYSIDDYLVLLSKDSLKMNSYENTIKLDVRYANFKEYIVDLSTRKHDRLIIITNKNDCSAIYDKECEEIFKRLGLTKSMLSRINSSYVGITIPSEYILYEEVSNDKIEKTIPYLKSVIEVVSNGKSSENSIKVDGVECSPQTRGWNICVINKETMELEEIASFDPYDGGNLSDGVILEY